MRNTKTITVEVDTRSARIRRAALPQPAACQDNVKATALIRADDGVTRQPPMQQTSFMHLLRSDSKAAELSRILDELSNYYRAFAADGQGDQASIVGKIYELACCLRKGGDTWLDFCRQPEWAGKRSYPKLEKQDAALAHVFKLICDHKARAGQNATAEVVVALRNLWAAGSSSEEVVAAINEAGGITAMARLERRRQRAEKGETQSQVSVIIEQSTLAKRLEEAAIGEVLWLKVVKRTGGKRQVYKALRTKRGKKREGSSPS